MSLYSGKCIWCIRRLSNYDFVLYCDYANWYLCIMDLCIMEYTMHTWYGYVDYCMYMLRCILEIGDCPTHGLSYMTEYRIGMLWYGIDCILCYTIQRQQTCMMFVWCLYDVVMMVCGVFMYLFGVLRMLECDVWMLDILVKYTCMYCYIVVIRLHCIVWFTLYNCNLITAYTRLQIHDLYDWYCMIVTVCYKFVTAWLDLHDCFIYIFVYITCNNCCITLITWLLDYLTVRLLMIVQLPWLL